ncbi:MAG: FAD-dependent monooxygenase [Candidatus Sumerlaeota bacterium]
MTALAKSYDVIVAGAGLAGGFAAYLMARAGRRVLLAERAPFPREKVCGCCLNGQAVALLLAHGIDVADHPAAIPITELEIRHRASAMVKPVNGGVILARSTLDQLIVTKAASHGAHFIDNCRVSVALRSPEMISATCFDELVGTRLLIEATGLAGRVDDQPSESPAAGSHLGAAATFSDDACDLKTGRIAMHVGDGGYVGLVRYTDGSIHAAAALAPALVKECGGIATAAQGILESCGRKFWRKFENEPWKGTALLTRRRCSFSRYRQFTIGDAAGYVEPFTGEGMAWALQSAHDVFPFAMEAIDAWTEELSLRWDASMMAFQRRRQRACRGVSYVLRRPFIVGAAIRADALLSPVYTSIIRNMTSAPPGEPARAAR